MNPFVYRDRALFCEEVSLAEIAHRAGTPCYVYSAAAIRKNYHAYDAAFGDAPHTVCYSVKANGSLSLLRPLPTAGARADTDSGGELYRLLAAGAHPSQ